MMTSHKDFPSDHLMSRPIVDDGMSSKLLIATVAHAAISPLRPRFLIAPFAVEHVVLPENCVARDSDP